ncbi:MAG: hypothetical protein NVS3B20_05930 [Polyangiales bacterium]
MIRTIAASLALTFVVLTASVRPSNSAGKDTAIAAKALIDSDDFRVRVDAALKLGSSGDRGARQPLEGALSDPHPTVRQSAALALSKLGDGGALPALEARVLKETNAPTKAALRHTIDQLRLGSTSTPSLTPDWSKTKYVLRLNKVTNPTGIRGDALSAVLLGSARTKLGALPGVFVLAEGAEGSLVQGMAVGKGVPVFGLDASVVSLDSASFQGDLQIRAKVSLTVTKLQVIKASIEGNASTLGSPTSTKNPSSMARLQDMAVDGAVSSATGKALGALKAVSGV